MTIRTIYLLVLLCCFFVLFHNSKQVRFEGSQEFGVLFLGSARSDNGTLEQSDRSPLEQSQDLANKHSASRKFPFEFNNMEEQRPTKPFHFHNETWSWKKLIRNNSIRIDYDKVTKACLQKLTGEEHGSSPYYTIYQVDSTVGFANQFRALVGVFLIALVTDRRLRIDWDDYYRVTDNVFSELRFNKSEVSSFKIKTYRSFSRGICQNPRFANSDINRIFGMRHLAFNTLSDLSCLVLRNPAYLQILRKIGFVVPQVLNSDEEHILRGQIARVLLTPNSELHYYIAKNLIQLDRKHVIGVQVRTGGHLSLVRESGRFLYQNTIFKIGQIVKNVIVQKGWNTSECVVFLTADSGLAFTKIRQDLEDSVKVVSTEGYRVGHSSSYLAYKQHNEFLKRAIVDLVLLSQSDFILYTYGSSYGRLARRLCLHSNHLVLQNNITTICIVC